MISKKRVKNNLPTSYAKSFNFINLVQDLKSFYLKIKYNFLSQVETFKIIADFILKKDKKIILIIYELKIKTFDNLYFLKFVKKENSILMKEHCLIICY